MQKGDTLMAAEWDEARSSEPPPWRGRGVAFAAILGALLLAWLVVRHSFVATLAGTDAEWALWLRPGYPVALLERADEALNGPLRRYKKKLAATPQRDRAALVPPAPIDARTRARVGFWTRKALSADPLNARGYRILGQLSEAAGDETQTERFMRRAAELSIRESLAVLWLMVRKIKAGNYGPALDDAEALLRTRPQLAGTILPILARMSGAESGLAPLVDRLARRPPWRGAFFRTLPGSALHPRVPLNLLLALKKTGAPPMTHELRPYLQNLLARKEYSLAYYTWLQFLSPDRLAKAGFPYNGGFQFDPSGLPFDWQTRQIEGAFIQFSHVPGSRGNRALLVEFFDRRVPFRHVSQTLMLAPGPYRLTGRAKAQLFAAHGLVWRLYCANGRNSSFAQTEPITGTTRSWQPFEMTFEVPQKDCRAQSLRLELLANTTSEQKTRGEIWFDDLKIRRRIKMPG